MLNKLLYKSLGRWLMEAGLVCLGSLLSVASVAQTSPDLHCPPPLLSRLKRHTVQAGETTASIAQRYQLLPTTLISVNAPLKDGNPKAGQVVLIPPFNGTQLTVPQGASWQDIAKAYGVRADVLFEVNGCQAKPSQVFIPGLAGRPTLPSPADSYTGLSRWPLEVKPSIGLDYGWQPDQKNPQNRFFHSGIDLLAPVGSPVLAAAAGTVLLVSQEGPYGFLVVLDHGNGRQTRYAQLSRFAVQVGERVPVGQILGQVGVTGKPDIPQAHLHFEVRLQSPVGWVAQDPKLHLPRVTSAGFSGQ